MTSDQPVLHALSVEPCSARAGETVCAVFRTRNLGALASPPGAVAFGFGAGLEPLGPTEIAIDPVEPGAEVTARAAARVAVPTVERTEVEVGAQLRFADRVLGTNRCIVAVRSRPVLNGPASGTFVDRVDERAARRTVQHRAAAHRDDAAIRAEHAVGEAELCADLDLGTLDGRNRHAGRGAGRYFGAGFDRIDRDLGRPERFEPRSETEGDGARRAGERAEIARPEHGAHGLAGACAAGLDRQRVQNGLVTRHDGGGAQLPIDV